MQTYTIFCSNCCNQIIRRIDSIDVDSDPGLPAPDRVRQWAINGFEWEFLCDTCGQERALEYLDWRIGSDLTHWNKEVVCSICNNTMLWPLAPMAAEEPVCSVCMDLAFNKDSLYDGWNYLLQRHKMINQLTALGLWPKGKRVNGLSLPQRTLSPAYTQYFPDDPTEWKLWLLWR